jgi:cytochrome c biogenesis protein CcmG/thiol:disulfide interchange protein DsbE
MLGAPKALLCLRCIKSCSARLGSFVWAALMVVGSISAQTNSDISSYAFPYHVALLTPDSLSVWSDEVFGHRDGLPTVVAFWLTTCGPCRQELAAYSRDYAERQRQRPFRLVAISIDFQERWQQVQAFAAQGNYPFPIYWDRTRAFKELLPGALNGLPQVFVFNADGQQVWHKKGYVPGAERELWEALERL